MFLNKTLALIVSCLAVGLFGPDAVRAGVRLTIDGKTFDDLGEKIATEIREPLRQEISKEGGTAFDVLDLGIIEGTKKPDSAVAYLGTVAGQVQREGKTAGVVTQWFWVKTRVKVDTLGGPFTTKVAAVECQLLLKLTWVPVISRGRPSLVGEAEIAKVHKLKERSAEQKHLDKLSDQTRTKLLAEVMARFSRANDLLPEAARNATVVSGMTIDEEGSQSGQPLMAERPPDGFSDQLGIPAHKPSYVKVVIELGDSGDGFAVYTGIGHLPRITPEPPGKSPPVVRPQKSESNVVTAPIPKPEPLNPKPAPKAEPLTLRPAPRPQPLTLQPAAKPEPLNLRPAPKAEPLTLRPAQKSQPMTLQPAPKAKVLAPQRSR